MKKRSIQLRHPAASTRIRSGIAFLSVCVLVGLVAFAGAHAQVATPATASPSPTATPFPPSAAEVSIQGEKFYINGVRTYSGGILDGTLPNSRMVNATFDDANPATIENWDYPNGAPYDPNRQANEFIAALPSYKAKGLLAVTLNFQGGDPVHGAINQPWDNTAFNSNGSLKSAYLTRMDGIIRALNAQGMVAILGYFYQGQDQRLANEAAVIAATGNATAWVLSQGYTNVMIEVSNEADNAGYNYAILKPPRVVELINQVKTQSINYGRRLYVSTSLNGGHLPSVAIRNASDFFLLHGDGQSPSQITAMINTARAWGFNKPIVFNEDSPSTANFQAATNGHASWGYHDWGANNYIDGFQSPPTNWTINTVNKRNFFNLLDSYAHSNNLYGVSFTDANTARSSSEGLVSLMAARQFLCSVSVCSAWLPCGAN